MNSTLWLLLSPVILYLICWSIVAVIVGGCWIKRSILNWK